MYIHMHLIDFEDVYGSIIGNKNRDTDVYVYVYIERGQIDVDIWKN